MNEYGDNNGDMNEYGNDVNNSMFQGDGDNSMVNDDDKGGSSGGGGGNYSKVKHVVPVTIKMLLNARKTNMEQDIFYIDDQTVNLMVIIGQIQKIPEVPWNQTSISYDIEDGTGQITLDIWIQNPEDQLYNYYNNKSIAQNWKKDTYVKVIGTLRSMGNTRHFRVRDMQAITDHNEITYHFLYTLQVHLTRTKGEINTIQNSTQSQSQITNDNYNSNVDNQSRSNVNNTKNNLSNNNNTTHGGQAFNDLQLKVLAIIRQGKPVIGVSTNEVISKLQNYDPKEIKTALRFLFDEGQLYNTSNFDHYSATD